MNRKTLLLVTASLLVLSNGCKKNDILLSDVFKGLQLSTITAIGDGAQTIGINCEINPAATDDNQEFLLKTSIGVFTENKDSKIIKKPEFKNGKLIIETTAQVPMSAGNMVISIEPNKPLEKRDFIIKDSVMITKSVASTIRLTTSALGLGNNFQSEVQLTGTLYNNNGGKVSTGYKVVFEDSLIASVPANGRFRDILNSSNSESKVSAFYGAINWPVGTDIKIRATLLDENGVKTGISDFIIIRINL